MKKIIMGILFIASVACAGDMPTSFNGTIIQGFAPNGLFARLLTINSTTIDLNTNCGGSLCSVFSIYAPADGKIRFMATSSKAGSISETVVGGQWNTFVTNKATAFVNLSSMASGMFRAQ